MAERDGQQFVDLVGVEFRALRPDRRTRDPQGAVVFYAADTFIRVGEAARKEDS